MSDETWRKTKDERDAKVMSLLTSLVADREAEKKVANARSEEEKKKPPPTIQTVLDASKAKKEEDDKRIKEALAGEFGKSKATGPIVLVLMNSPFPSSRSEIKKQNDASQKTMLEEMKKSVRFPRSPSPSFTADFSSSSVPFSFFPQAREQVAFNVSGHLDGFSKSLASEVKILMKEVGDLRESKRALQHEIADLLLIKARHGGGDGMNLFPWQGAAKVSRRVSNSGENDLTFALFQPPAAAAKAGDKPPATVPAKENKPTPPQPPKPILQVPQPPQPQQRIGFVFHPFNFSFLPATS